VGRHALEDTAMKFMMFIKHAEDSHFVAPPKPLMDAMGAFIGEGRRTGWLKETGGMKSTSEGLRIRSTGGRLIVTDGPFTEAKEIVGGYAIVETESKGEAMEIARRFMGLHRIHWPEFECEGEVRPIEEVT
jgi:hypothetical protein